MSDWQPIENFMGEDGAPVLLTPAGSYWHSIGCRYDGIWYDRLENFGTIGIIQPTHWMHLPEPPK